MVAVPTDTPVTTPALETVARDVLLLAHVPPGGDPPSEVVAPTQVTAVPETGSGAARTVIVFDGLTIATPAEPEQLLWFGVNLHASVCAPGLNVASTAAFTALSVTGAGVELLTPNVPLAPAMLVVPSYTHWYVIVLVLLLPITEQLVLPG